MPGAIPVLSSLYLGPVRYFRVLQESPAVIIDLHEHYLKQTWRNRCRIAGPNGLQDLIVPVEKYANHTPAGEIRISYREPWQRSHWRSIRTAYGNSPYFEFYADHFAPFYGDRKPERLHEWNMALLQICLRLLKLNCTVNCSSNYAGPAGADDLRETISPKKPADAVTFHPYPQVFAERHGFVPDLSVIDLLCCTGPDAQNYLGRLSDF